MLVDIKGMVDAALVKPTSRRKLGHGGANKLGVAQHRVSPMTGRKNAFELNAHALACHGIEQRRALGKRLFGLRLDHKIQTAGKTHRAQHAKRVLVKATLRISDGTDKFTLKVALAIAAVDKTTIGMPSHGINGKVTARQIVLKRSRTLHTLGMAAIGVKTVQAVRRALNALAIANGRDAAKFNARLNHGNVSRLERRLGLLPQAAAAHINIVAGAPHQGITHPTANIPSLKTGCLERTQDTDGGIGRLRTVERNIAHSYGLLRLQTLIDGSQEV